MTGVLIKRRNLDTGIDMHREKTSGRDRVKMAIYKPKRYAWNRSFPHSPQKEEPC